MNDVADIGRIALGRVLADLVAHVKSGALRTALEHERYNGRTGCEIFKAAVLLRDLIDQTICSGCGGIYGECGCDDQGYDD
jgi:hypothetical protein